MSSSIVEFIYLTLKPGVRPEEPANAANRAFNETLTTVTQQSGYEWSAWGRTIENENDIVWVVAWIDTTSGVPLTRLEPVLEEGTVPISFHATLTPPLSRETLTQSAAIEVCALCFPSSLSPDDKAALDKDLINFRSSLLEIKPPQQGSDAKAPKSFSLGWVDRPANLQHPDSPSGHALLNLLVVGWGSKEEHEAARKTENFTTAIAPIRERMLPAIQALGMRHVKFRSQE